jgi:hypothetical protein
LLALTQRITQTRNLHLWLVWSLALGHDTNVEARWCGTHSRTQGGLTMFKAFITGVKWGFLGYVRGGSGLTYEDDNLSNAFDKGANWGERLHYGRSFGGARW